MSHIIIEGCDKSGKTYLSKAIQKEINFYTIDDIVYTDSMFKEYISILLNEQSHLIFDRLSWSEVVYGPVKRNYSEIDFREHKIIELLCSTLDTFNIYCYDSFDNIKKRFIEDNEDYLTFEDINKILNGYEKILSNSSLNWHKYKIGDSIEELIVKIKEHFSKLNYKKINKYLEYRTIGDLNNSKYLIVAEKYGGIEPKQPLVPFGSNRPGLLLFNALNATNIRWNEVAFTNSIKYTNREFQLNDYSENALKEEMQIKNIESIICLGNNSYDYTIKVMEKFKIKKKIYKIPHPSYWLNYSGKPLNEYSELFKKIII